VSSFFFLSLFLLFMIVLVAAYALREGSDRFLLALAPAQPRSSQITSSSAPLASSQAKKRKETNQPPKLRSSAGMTGLWLPPLEDDDAERKVYLRSTETGTELKAADGTDLILADRGTSGKVRNWRKSNKAVFSHQLKILVSFVQILTTLAFTLDTPWPTAFRQFLTLFDWINMDFVRFSSAGCVVSLNYYATYVTMMLLPVVLTFLITIVFGLPKYVSLRHRSAQLTRAEIDQESRVLWSQYLKLNIFMLFLVYTRVSATSLGLLVCQEVEGVSYLVADFSIICHLDTPYVFSLPEFDPGQQLNVVVLFNV
jgi:hypothetical protein